MIRHTNEVGGENVLSAYSDNAAVVAGHTAGRFSPDVSDRIWRFQDEPIHLLMKVETHNHPTAISPFAGAGTGAGGEIRDEGAVGRGSRPKAGLVGFTVSHLEIPEQPRPWELQYGKPGRIVSPLQIMTDGPIGAAAFNNEFGRPNLAGYFRTFEAKTEGGVRGYHKPIMIAGGFGNIREDHVEKGDYSVERSSSYWADPRCSLAWVAVPPRPWPVVIAQRIWTLPRCSGRTRRSSAAARGDRSLLESG